MRDSEHSSRVRSRRSRFWGVGLILVVAVALAIAYFRFATGTLRVNSLPRGASVWVDAKRIGESPLTKRLIVGHHHVTVSMDGYGTFKQEEVPVVRGRPVEIFAVLPVLVDSSPLGADVYIDGTHIGRTPVPYDFEAGIHRIVLRKAGYLELTKTMIAGQGIMAPLPVFQLVRDAERHLVAITSQPEGAYISVDGQTAGITPSTVAMIAGQRRIQLIHPGYQPDQAIIDVPADSAYHAVLTRAVTYGKLSVNALPFATVHLDGQLQGETPLVVEGVSTGEHQLKLSRPGYLIMEFTVTVEENETTRIGIRAEEWTAADE